MGPDVEFGRQILQSRYYKHIQRVKESNFKKLKENKTIKTKQIETLSREAHTFLKNQMSGWVAHFVKQLT